MTARMTAKQFNDIRVDKGLSQREMAIAMGVRTGRPEIVKSWEKGKILIPKAVAKTAWRLKFSPKPDPKDSLS